MCENRGKISDFLNQTATRDLAFKKFRSKRIARINAIQEKAGLHNHLLNICAIFFISLYVIITIFWMGAFAFNIEKKAYSWNNYVCIMFLLGAIHIWIYSLLKNIPSIEKLRTLFPESGESYKTIYKQLKDLIWPFPWTKGCTYFENLLKLLYALLYMTLVGFIIHAILTLHLLTDGDGIADHIVLVSVYFLLFVGAVLNYFTYFGSLVFCFFSRRIANADIKCEDNCEVPWNSIYLRKLIHISSRNSMSFFFVSMMYLVAVTVSLFPIITTDSFVLDSIYGNNCVLLLGSTVFLCVISFFIVALLPKIFFNRLFRRWKFSQVEKYNDIIKTSKGKKKKAFYEERISAVWDSKLPYVRMELATALVALFIDFAALVVSIVTLFKA